MMAWHEQTVAHSSCSNSTTDGVTCRRECSTISAAISRTRLMLDHVVSEAKEHADRHRNRKRFLIAEPLSSCDWLASHSRVQLRHYPVFVNTDRPPKALVTIAQCVNSGGLNRTAKCPAHRWTSEAISLSSGPMQGRRSISATTRSATLIMNTGFTCGIAQAFQWNKEVVRGVNLLDTRCIRSIAN